MAKLRLCKRLTRWLVHAPYPGTSVMRPKPRYNAGSRGDTNARAALWRRRRLVSAALLASSPALSGMYLRVSRWCPYSDHP